MILHDFPFLLLCLLATIPSCIHAVPPPRGYFINCGSSKAETIRGIEWIPDQDFIDVGNVSTINTPDIMPILSSVRYFPDKTARKYCYVVPVAKGAKFLIRATYYYGGFDGGKEPPVFDQIVDGTRWSRVNTSQSYANGLSSYYEIIVVTHGKTLSFCLARNNDTVSSPFISALEFISLENSMYNSTDFRKYALITVARHNFGQEDQIMSYPDDPYNRYWEPFIDSNPRVESHSNVTTSEFWNIPPEKILQTALTASRGKQLVVHWPKVALPSASYFIVLYFQDSRTPSPYSWRVFSVAVNSNVFYKDLNATSDGVMVYAAQWPLSGDTQITLTPADDSPVGPLINAGEIYQIVHLGRRTLTREVIAMEDLARSLSNTPPDWSGDPCLPEQHSWNGVICSTGGTTRIVGLNLTNLGLSGSLPDSIGNLTAIKEIRLEGNNISGSIPDMGSIKNLVILHLNDNQFSGSIPSSLAELQNLKQLYIFNNKLTGSIPGPLQARSGLEIKY